MTEARTAFLRVGLLILAGAALLIGLVWFLGGARIRGGTLYESYFSESVQGLEIGVAVKYRGVAIGRVTDIGLVTAEYRPDAKADIDQATYRLVYVRYLVDPKRLGRMPDTESAVKAGLRSRLASAGLTGVTYIELDFVDPNRNPASPVPWTPSAEYIPSVPTTLTQVEDATRMLIERMNEVDIVRMAKTANAMLDDADGLVRELAEQVRAANVPELVADLRQAIGAVRMVAENPDLKRTLAGAAATTDQLARLTAQLPPLIAQIPPLITTAQGVVRRADSGVADTQQALVPLLRDMMSTVASLREIAESLRRNPAQILVGQPPPRQPEHAR